MGPEAAQIARRLASTDRSYSVSSQSLNQSAPLRSMGPEPKNGAGAFSDYRIKADLQSGLRLQISYVKDLLCAVRTHSLRGQLH